MSVWFTRLTLKRDDAAIKPLIRSLAPDEGGAAMNVNHRLMWTLATPETQAACPSGAAFLWREIERGEKFYLLGPRPVETSPFFTVETKPYMPQFAPGDMLAFELRVNPTVARRSGEARRSARSDVVMDRLRAQEASGATRETRAARRDAAAHEAVRDWLARIGERDGFVLHALRLDSYRVESVARRGGAARFGVCDLGGVLEVTDGEAFRARVLTGFGRAKAFGCGLMLLRRRP